MKIKLIAFEHGISCIGFRRLSSLLKSKGYDVETFIYNLSGASMQYRGILFKAAYGKRASFNEEFMAGLRDATFVGVSGMSSAAEVTKQFILRLKEINPDCFVAWGGVHATVFPEDAINYADAVCIGEGERAISELLERLDRGLAYLDTPGFWFSRPEGTIRNPTARLLSNAELSEMPYQDYGFDIWHVTDKKIVIMTKDIYFGEQGSSYRTLWSLGCPFSCTYCSNSTFISNNKDNAKIRYPSSEHITGEIYQILKLHNYINYIIFQDDLFLLINQHDIEEFANLYSSKIALPFFIAGLHPNVINEQKIKILLDAGMRKVRMGIQSGSDKILSFYKRKHTRADILKKTNYLADLYPRIIPPFYDIIIDNPIETENDKMETISLLYKIARPYCLYVFGLRVIPGTSLAEFAEQHPELPFLTINITYHQLQDVGFGFLVYLLGFWRPPLRFFNLLVWLSKKKWFARPGLFTVKVLCLIKRAYYELKMMNLQPIAVFSPRAARFVQKVLWRGPKRAWQCSGEAPGKLPEDTTQNQSLER